MTMPTATTPATTADVPVQKSVTVKASAERAFRTFTEDFDSWWPKSHHIGSSPLTQSVIEGRVGGRCYAEQEDGTDCPWGTILAWEPPHRLVMAWQITPEWKYQPDLAQASEVELRFTPIGNGLTRVDLEHRHFARHGAGADAMRVGVSGPDGWAALLTLFAAAAEAAA